MEKFGSGQSVRRTEDVRFLTGAGRYIDDTPPKGSLFGCVFRSPAQWPTITQACGRSTAMWSVAVLAFEGPTPMFTRVMPEPSARLR